MKALSIRQPWAWLVLHGGKDIENREWRTRYRGLVLIHASGTMTREDYEACAIFVAGIYDRLRLDFMIPEPGDLQYGGIVGQVEIVDCCTLGKQDDFLVTAGRMQRDWSPWFTGPFGFVLRNPQALAFQPCRGMPGLFDLCPSVSICGFPSPHES